MRKSKYNNDNIMNLALVQKCLFFTLWACSYGLLTMQDANWVARMSKTCTKHEIIVSETELNFTGFFKVTGPV